MPSDRGGDPLMGQAGRGYRAFYAGQIFGIDACANEREYERGGRDEHSDDRCGECDPEVGGKQTEVPWPSAASPGASGMRVPISPSATSTWSRWCATLLLCKSVFRDDPLIAGAC
jgi:hypothetical protein